MIEVRNEANWEEEDFPEVVSTPSVRRWWNTQGQQWSSTKLAQGRAHHRPTNCPGGPKSIAIRRPPSPLHRWGPEHTEKSLRVSTEPTPCRSRGLSACSLTFGALSVSDRPFHSTKPNDAGGPAFRDFSGGWGSWATQAGFWR